MRLVFQGLAEYEDLGTVLENFGGPVRKHIFGKATLCLWCAQSPSTCREHADPDEDSESEPCSDCEDLESTCDGCDRVVSLQLRPRRYTVGIGSSR
jgi:hypothetical protein